MLQPVCSIGEVGGIMRTTVELCEMYAVPTTQCFDY